MRGATDRGAMELTVFILVILLRKIKPHMSMGPLHTRQREGKRRSNYQQSRVDIDHLSSVSLSDRQGHATVSDSGRSVLPPLQERLKMFP